MSEPSTSVPRMRLDRVQATVRGFACGHWGYVVAVVGHCQEPEPPNTVDICRSK